jgi:HEPN domain-containing protein/predicted nucleotidyltransferase
MLTTLDAILERLIERYDPDRIILFGSRAITATKADGDVDLLIVKETDKRPVDRRVEVERLLADRSVPLDLLVYTPRELRELYAAGDPFIERVVETGRVLYMRKATAAWLREEAQEELESASILLTHGKHRGACFHSQQCVEKSLKAPLLEKGRQPVFLNSVYRGRYSTEAGLLPHGEPTAEDAQRAVRTAELVMARARAALAGASPSNPDRGR